MSALRDAIVQHLQGDPSVADLATGGIHPGFPPEMDADGTLPDSLYPFITVTAQKAPVGEWAFQEVAFEDAVYLVKAIDKSTSGAVVADINAAVRVSLNLATLTITGYASMGVMWLRDVQYDEIDGSQQYQHEGGLYSLMAEPT